MTQLYRHYDAQGVLLYVGISLSAVTRLSQHKAASWHDKIARVEVMTYPDRASALKAEAVAIHHENPLHNVSRPALEPITWAQVQRSIDRVRADVYLAAWDQGTVDPDYPPSVQDDVLLVCREAERFRDALLNRPAG